MILLALALQAAAPATTPDRFSILAKPCGQRDEHGDIVVCGQGDGNRLPLPDDRAPPDGQGANHDLSGANALALEGTPCAATQRGCLVGFGPPIVPIVKAAAGAVKSAFAKKPDKRGRVAIDLDGTAPIPAGELRP